MHIVDGGQQRSIRRQHSLVKPRLPDRSVCPQAMVPAPREAGLDKPHDFSRCHAIRQLYHQVHVVRHDHPGLKVEVKLFLRLGQSTDKGARRVSIIEEGTAVRYVRGDKRWQMQSVEATIHTHRLVMLAEVCSTAKVQMALARVVLDGVRLN
ncbi:MAG TPA: hypothetical protein VLS25_05610 [Dehalococcoidia bacterium]|nr:hypothetical protein [Dehalococcoidia bacterium]